MNASTIKWETATPRQIMEDIEQAFVRMALELNTSNFGLEEPIGSLEIYFQPVVLPAVHPGLHWAIRNFLKAKA